MAEKSEARAESVIRCRSEVVITAPAVCRSFTAREPSGPSLEQLLSARPLQRPAALTRHEQG